MSNDTGRGSQTTPSRGQPFKKKPLDPHLFSGAKGTADDVRVQAGYPVWTLIAQWQAANYSDDLLLASYPDLPREEWEAAKGYYRTHKPFIDARIIINSQPSADDDVPPCRLPTSILPTSPAKMILAPLKRIRRQWRRRRQLADGCAPGR